MTCNICDDSGIIEFRHGLPVRCPECDSDFGNVVYLYKIRHAKTGKYHSSKRWPAYTAWNRDGRHYTMRALAQVLSSMTEPVIIEKWVSYKESEHIG